MEASKNWSISIFSQQFGKKRLRINTSFSNQPSRQLFAERQTSVVFVSSSRRHLFPPHENTTCSFPWFPQLKVYSSKTGFCHFRKQLNDVISPPSTVVLNRWGPGGGGASIKFQGARAFTRSTRCKDWSINLPNNTFAFTAYLTPCWDLKQRTISKRDVVEKRLSTHWSTDPRGRLTHPHMSQPSHVIITHQWQATKDTWQVLPITKQQHGAENTERVSQNITKVVKKE